MSAISIDNLVVKFGEVAVLRDLNLAVDPGEFLVLLGSSGCGKSTLLNVIAGLLEPADGSITIGGRDVTWIEPDRRGIAMVFQSYALYPKMSVRDNLGFALRVARVAKAERAARVAKVADFLQLTPLLDRRPAQLSGGQRQRVAIGRALVREADVFLFDEPLSNLDAKLRAELRIEIKRLHRTTRKTMVYVTHDQIEALTLADRVAVMKDGIIQQLASPEELYDRPSNRYVAGFIGSPGMNFLPGVLTAGPAPRLTSAVGSFNLHDYPFAASPRTGDARVELGVRPEALFPVDPKGPDAMLRGTVDLTEMLGAESILWCDIAGQQVAVLAQGKPPVAAGAPIGLRFDLHRASLFDTATGQRL
ncbi:ABC transporter ATP-binding protein [Natronohydrobacter thiooxidans]|uniref:ABC transporter ATP-binding protein n=1 Tax=Natronohydrobacter thiooxidans TaxID=87172 RepID=UPI0008FF5FA9|nr:ABC transporter ATP-binding protein [Natronohydrobacter thiooxidans]